MARDDFAYIVHLFVVLYKQGNYNEKEKQKSQGKS